MLSRRLQHDGCCRVRSRDDLHAPVHHSAATDKRAPDGFALIVGAVLAAAVYCWLEKEWVSRSVILSP